MRQLHKFRAQVQPLPVERTGTARREAQLMAGNKKPRKPYRPTWNGGGVKLRTEPWKVEAVFRPLINILDALDNDGTVTCTAAGVPIFQDTNDGCWYEMAPAIEGVIAAYEVHGKRQHRDMPLAPLQLLCRKLAYSMPIEQKDVDAARAALVVLRVETNEMTAAYAADLVRITQIRVEMDAKVAA